MSSDAGGAAAEVYGMRVKSEKERQPPRWTGLFAFRERDTTSIGPGGVLRGGGAGAVCQAPAKSRCNIAPTERYG